jgi:Ca-activated chloride channel homolog
MARRLFALASVILFLITPICVSGQKGQSNMPVFHVHVDMVQLEVAVTDKNGNYVTGLRPQSFAVYEDGILQKIATFGSGNQPPKKLEDIKPEASAPRLIKFNAPEVTDPSSKADPVSIAGASVFVLFDTSNYMFRGFVFAQDAIAQFVRSLVPSDRVAFYSYSRDFFRASLLTLDRSTVLHGVRRTVAGDDAALYDALLWTLEDAGKFSGKRAIVVFSNGPDNASMVSPEDVRELAQSEGIPIYMVSTRAAESDPLSTAVFKRVSASTGGKAYFARHWKDEQKAFASIREDLAHLYALSYYPQANPNSGWRKITVKLVGQDLGKYHVRTRSGYRPRVARMVEQMPPIPGPETTPVSSLSDKQPDR